MSDPWLYLLRRYGEEIGSPSATQIEAAISELFHENLPGMNEANYDEHGAASLRYGYDDGPMYVLELSRGRSARWEEWADQDYNDEICPPKELSSLSEERANELWSQLARGKIDEFRAAFHAIK
jgi:hypothetical protein